MTDFPSFSLRMGKVRLATVSPVFEEISGVGFRRVVGYNFISYNPALGIPFATNISSPTSEVEFSKSLAMEHVLRHVGL